MRSFTATTPPASPPWPPPGRAGTRRRRPTARPALRRQALGRLRADLAAWQTRLAADPAKGRDAVHKKMLHWLADADLGIVRHPIAIGLLPADERAAWKQLWAEVRGLRDKTAPPDRR